MTYENFLISQIELSYNLSQMVYNDIIVEESGSEEHPQGPQPTGVVYWRCKRRNYKVFSLDDNGNVTPNVFPAKKILKLSDLVVRSDSESLGRYPSFPETPTIRTLHFSLLTSRYQVLWHLRVRCQRCIAKSRFMS